MGLGLLLHCVHDALHLHATVTMRVAAGSCTISVRRIMLPDHELACVLEGAAQPDEHHEDFLLTMHIMCFVARHRSVQTFLNGTSTLVLLFRS